MTDQQKKDTAKTPWDYAPAGERAAINALSLAGAAAAVIPLTLIFNPAAVGIAAGLAAYQTWRIHKAAVRDRQNPPLKDDFMEPLEGHHQLKSDIADLSRIYNLAATPQLYRLDPDYADIMTHGERRSNPLIFATLIATDTTRNQILVTDQSVNAYPRSEMRFVMAHEMAHIKTGDSEGVRTFLHGFSLRLGFIMGGLALISFGLAAVAGISVPFLLPVAGVSSFGFLGAMALSYFGSKTGFNGASRLMEYRADRNALYVTQDKNAARHLLTRITNYGRSPDDADPMRGYPYLIEAVFATHPSYPRRMEGLEKAWQRVAAAIPPPAPATNDNIKDGQQKNDVKLPPAQGSSPLPPAA